MTVQMNSKKQPSPSPTPALDVHFAELEHSARNGVVFQFKVYKIVTNPSSVLPGPIPTATQPEPVYSSKHYSDETEDFQSDDSVETTESSMDSALEINGVKYYDLSDSDNSASSSPRVQAAKESAPVATAPAERLGQQHAVKTCTGLLAISGSTHASKQCRADNIDSYQEIREYIRAAHADHATQRPLGTFSAWTFSLNSVQRSRLYTLFDLNELLSTHAKASIFSTESESDKELSDNPDAPVPVKHTFVPSTTLSKQLMKMGLKRQRTAADDGMMKPRDNGIRCVGIPGEAYQPPPPTLFVVPVVPRPVVVKPSLSGHNHHRSAPFSMASENADHSTTRRVKPSAYCHLHLRGPYAEYEQVFGITLDNFITAATNYTHVDFRTVQAMLCDGITQLGQVLQVKHDEISKFIPNAVEYDTYRSIDSGAMERDGFETAYKATLLESHSCYIIPLNLVVELIMQLPTLFPGAKSRTLKSTVYASIVAWEREHGVHMPRFLSEIKQSVIVDKTTSDLYESETRNLRQIVTSMNTRMHMLERELQYMRAEITDLRRDSTKTSNIVRHSENMARHDTESLFFHDTRDPQDYDQQHKKRSKQLHYHTGMSKLIKTRTHRRKNAVRS